MDKYKILIAPRAYRDLDNIYAYIKDNLLVPETALKLANLISDTIFSLDYYPYKGTERKTGIYANKGYRQIFVKKYTIVYKIDEDKKQVVVMAIRYSSSNF